MVRRSQTTIVLEPSSSGYVVCPFRTRRIEQAYSVHRPSLEGESLPVNNDASWQNHSWAHLRPCPVRIVRPVVPVLDGVCGEVDPAGAGVRHVQCEAGWRVEAGEDHVGAKGPGRKDPRLILIRENFHRVDSPPVKHHCATIDKNNQLHIRARKNSEP